MSDDGITIVTGYRPGIVGRCLELQARYYADRAGFGRVFETGRANDIAAFFAREPDGRSRFWSALRDDVVIGTVAIDGEGLGANVSQLRWFIVDDSARGTGLGRRLLREALAFCDNAGFSETHLWTFAGLDAARHLYDAAGFVLVDAAATTEWGPEVLGQHFVRPGPGVHLAAKAPAGTERA